MKLESIMDKIIVMDLTTTLSYKLLNRILIAMDIDLKAGRLDSVKERRVLWTTFRNLKFGLKTERLVWSVLPKKTTMEVSGYVITRGFPIGKIVVSKIMSNYSMFC